MEITIGLLGYIVICVKKTKKKNGRRRDVRNCKVGFL